ncbi:class I SAM-dependent methyltransferase [Desulfobacula sp.]|uniref:class I SAM-dependent methyltransferase n=1 Tax=Desulfobacula sp. TaxID=2593537 RepID=UPI002613D643|nr:class I SAM-dependent methyltransferase [Desulfobacula sp.]
MNKPSPPFSVPMKRKRGETNKNTQPKDQKYMMESNVKDYYNSDNLRQNIETAFIKAGKPPVNLELRDLSPIDQLHTGGARASLDLFKKIHLSSDAVVLDAGCGIGGSARLLAQQVNCRVMGVDLAERFIEAATFLTRCTRLDHMVTFQQGSILDLPFEDHTFDAVLCQHILMNIEDKSKAVKEFFRVLKPEGKLLLHEITRGDHDRLLFPVPWAGKADISFLETWESLSALFERQGFDIRFSSNETRAAWGWWEKVKAVSQKKGPQPNFIGPGLIFGKNASSFGNNMHTNFKKNAICLMEAVLEKS